ncbi:hypothetical protein AOLI_G00019090 [Acnodon oligacanthus]
MKVLIFCVVLSACITGTLQNVLDIQRQVCYTEWFDRDDPSGNGDYETLTDLRKEYPEKICSQPLTIQAVTMSGVAAEKTGQVIQIYDTVAGFACVNAQQKRGYCLDYKVRFGCPCAPQVCYSQWFDRDDPSGNGDYETLTDLRKEYPGEICSQPLTIQAVTMSGVPAENSGKVIQTYDTVVGFACVNAQQKNGDCLDYKVRFGCPCAPQVCYTQWFDRDDPSGKGDYETLVDLRIEYPGKICPKPLSIQATTISGVPAEKTGEVIQTSDTVVGFACVNTDQKNGNWCLDYKVRFGCPCPFP